MGKLRNLNQDLKLKGPPLNPSEMLENIGERIINLIEKRNRPSDIVIASLCRSSYKFVIAKTLENRGCKLKPY